MPSHLLFTVRFLDPVPQFHGRGDDGDPEWPPAPLRFFQAMLSAAATRWRGGAFESYARPALRWLEQKQAEIVTPSVNAKSFGFRMYVPNNAGDLMAGAWKNGNWKATPSNMKLLVEKDSRPVKMHDEAIHYLIPVDAAFEAHRETLRAAARSITHLGWGVDMVAADARVIDADEAAKLPGERWVPGDSGSVALRMPKLGTLDDLLQRHEKFLRRLDGGGFKPVPPLTAFDVVHYRRATDTPQKPWVAFQILDSDGEGMRAFDTPRRTVEVAAWVRHAAGAACQGWPFGDVGAFIHGHADEKTPLRGEAADSRLSFLPLPSVERRGELGIKVGAIRRVLVVAPSGCNAHIDWLRRRLPAHDLVFNNDIVGMLNLLPKKDWVLEQYTKASRVWSTVTPVVLQRHEISDREEIRRLVKLALAQAGVCAEYDQDDLECGPFGFRAGVEPAGRFRTAKSLSGTRVHVRVRFRQPVSGPLAIGAGRYRGFGTFAAHEESD